MCKLFYIKYKDRDQSPLITISDGSCGWKVIPTSNRVIFPADSIKNILETLKDLGIDIETLEVIEIERVNNEHKS